MYRLRMNDQYLQQRTMGTSRLGERKGVEGVVKGPNDKYVLLSYDLFLRGNLPVMEPGAIYGSSYLDPRADFVFKYIFGREAHKDLLIDFLNSVFEGEKVIRDLYFSSTERQEEEKRTRKVLFDLLCIGEQGERFLVEMQRNRQDFFAGRTLHYGHRISSELIPAGKDGNDFNLPEVYVIAIIDFNLWDEETPPAGRQNACIHCYDLRRRGSWEPFPKKFELRFLELRKFNKAKEDLHTRLDKWLYALKHLGGMTERPAFLGDPTFVKLFKTAEIKNLNKEDKEMLIDHERDLINIGKVWKREALERGLKRGLKQGEARVKEKERSVVERLLRETDFDDRKIASLAGVEENFVRKVRSGIVVSD